ncbi:TonB-dependent receptor [Litorivivens sp.]|uniref:TonB-dependent receptor n=1 Tax=Litorivivens sp. TaxID=2020868 RepID=UPI00356A4D8F
MKKYSKWLAACAAAMVLPDSVAAQERRPVLEEVMVTAQKREESLQDVPISVVAVDAEMMRDANMEDMADIAVFTPNLSVFSHPPLTSLRVRGLGSPFDKGFEHSAGLFLDGVYVGRLAFLDAAFLDVQSVEILRGPQGTLFGKNTISGAISIRSVQPSQEPEMSGSIAAGDENLKKYTLAGNLPLGDRLAIRAAINSNERDGTVYNTTLDRDEGSTDSEAGRVQLRWDILDWLDVTLAAAKTEQEFRLGTFQVRTASDDQFQLMQFYDPQVEKDVSNFQSAQNYPAETTQDGGKYDIRFNASLWDHEVALIAARSEIEELSLTDLDFSPIPLLFFLNGEDYEQDSLELRVVSPLGLFGGKLDYVGGIYAAKSETDIQVIIDAAPDPLALANGLAATGGSLGPITSLLAPVVGDEPGERLLIDGYQEGTSRAIYGQASWHFSPEWTLTGGLRYSREEKTVDQTLQLFSAGTDADGPVFTQLVTAEEYRLIDKRVDRDISPKLSLNWNPNDELTAYASAAEGFKGGGYSGSAVRAEITEVEPEHSETYEVGVKTRLFDRAATLNVALFYTQFEDLQLTIFEGNVSRISNAAGAISKGAEVDAAFVTAFGLSGNLSLAYLDARFTDYENGPCPAGEDPPCDLTDDHLAFAPFWKSSLSLNYQAGLFDWPVTWLVGADVLFEDEKLLQADQDPIDVQGAFTTFNARVRVADIEERWSIQALLRNATDEDALDGGGDIPTLSGAHFGRAIAPRQLDVTLRFSF